MGRQDARNGHYRRGLTTSLGKLEVQVPRTRHGGSAGAVLERYKRRTEEVDEAITAAYVQGVSTRKMGRVTKVLEEKVIVVTSVRESRASLAGFHAEVGTVSGTSRHTRARVTQTSWAPSAVLRPFKRCTPASRRSHVADRHREERSPG
ncbi:transposase [Myxococcus sp. RHST-1-4]|nr:transposase [Myxococcus sp. RHSTA-1-4]